jgi:ABC-type multidrug transport system ATPase subunit
MSDWSLDAVSHRYGRGALALREVSLRAAPRDWLGLCGPSGCGKTTALRIGAGLLRPTEGVARVDGRALRGPGEVHVLFQDPKAMLHPTLAVGALLEESARRHQPGRDPRRAAADALEAQGLGHRANARPWELSGGEQRRVGLARVLLARPSVVLIDEPTAGLDGPLREGVWRSLVDAFADVAVVVVSHDLADLAQHTQRLALLDRGQVVDGLDSAAVCDGRAEPTSIEGRRLLDAAGWRPR